MVLNHDTFFINHYIYTWIDYFYILINTGVPADGRCLFRAIAHMVCLKNGEEAPDENRQKLLADELRIQVKAFWFFFSSNNYMISFLESNMLSSPCRSLMSSSRDKKRSNGNFLHHNLDIKFTAWTVSGGSTIMINSFVMFIRFIEEDFDAYVKRIEKPFVWGGEPELLMASHVLKWVLYAIYMYNVLLFRLKICIKKPFFCMCSHGYNCTLQDNNFGVHVGEWV